MSDQGDALLTRILVPLDGSLLGDRILTFVDRLPDRAGLDLVLVRVVEPAVGDERWEEEVALAQQHLRAVEAGLRERRLRASHFVTSGEPVERILEAVRLLDPSLVAMSTRGRGGLGRALRGSVAERVLRECPVPLLVGNPASLPLDPGQGFARILVPLDGSELAARVLPLVVPLARTHQAEVVLLRVENFERPGALEHLMTEDETAATLAPFAARLRADGVPRVRCLGRVGGEAARILETVDREAVDLVAMTTHGRSGVARLWWGSVAEEVVRRCAAPLLLLRSAAPPAPREGRLDLEPLSPRGL